jgi:manganese/iron transport system ATP-binding protein
MKTLFSKNKLFSIELESSHSPATLMVQQLTAGYNGTPALQDLTFEVEHGSRVAVVGPNGAGKSTLFKVLVGLVPIRAGDIKIHGLPLGDHQYCVAYVPQREEVDWHFPVTVSDVVMMGRFGRQGWLSRSSQEDRQAVKRSLDIMGINEYALASISDLSGGQQQRVFLARAIAQEPHILLMDEPFTGVDAPTQESTLELLDRLKEKDVTVLVSTHDLNMASHRFDQVLLLNKRLIAFGKPAQVFSKENVREAFGSHLLYMEDAAMIVDECCPGGYEDHHK